MWDLFVLVMNLSVEGQASTPSPRWVSLIGAVDRARRYSRSFDSYHWLGQLLLLLMVGFCSRTEFRRLGMAERKLN